MSVSIDDMRIDNISSGLTTCVDPNPKWSVQMNLPFAEDITVTVDKSKCPICGGGLIPMGWFRQCGVMEMLFKCKTCGNAVFRDVPNYE